MRGIIAAGHDLTAQAGAEILKKGGNAFDAAVAAMLASFVCESALTSMGGGGFMMAHKSCGATQLYDFFPDVSGRGFTGDKDKLHFYPVEIDFSSATQVFYIGKGSVATPGNPAGIASIYNTLCSMELATLFKPAIRYAREGVILNARQASFNNILNPILTIPGEGATVYAPQGTILREGQRIFNSKMADTFEDLASNGLDQFYNGPIANRIVERFSDGGLITKEDLNAYTVQIRDALEVNYRDSAIFVNPPPSSGGCLIAFSLKMLQQFDLGKTPNDTRAFLSRLIKTMIVTDEARGEDFDHRVYEQNLIETFFDDERISRYRQKINGAVSPGASPSISSSGNTTHISVIDGEGNAASVTTSNGEGCGYMIPQTGVMINNMLGEEDINPHGFHTQQAGIRMSSMMAPTIVIKDDKPSIVTGSGGSNRIRNAILQVLLNIIDFNKPVSEAANDPRTHWEEGRFHVEKGVDSAAVKALEENGFKINRWHQENMFFGGAHTVCMDNKGALSGSGDLRRGGVCLTV